MEEVREPEREKVLADMATGRMALEESFFETDYYLVQFEIDEFGQHVARFGTDLAGELTEPFMESARQIPRVAARCVLGSISPSRYLMLYQVSDAGQSRDNVVSTCK